MLVAEGAVEIRVLSRQGKSIREIARMLEVSRNTVRRYLRSEGLPRYQREARPSKLDPYRQYVDERVKAAAPDWIPATVLLRELRALGYPGGYSILKNYLATLRPVATLDPVIRFETEPGRQMQADFATIRRGCDRLAVFIATLGWSRATYVEFVTDEPLETLLGCHERAFYFFGGEPREVLYDNMRTVVSDRDQYGPGLHRYNRTFLDFAHHYGFCRGCADRIGRRPKARSSASSAVCAGASTFRWPVSCGPTDSRSIAIRPTLGSGPGSARSPTRACMRPRARFPGCDSSWSASGCNRCPRRGRDRLSPFPQSVRPHRHWDISIRCVCTKS